MKAARETAVRTSVTGGDTPDRAVVRRRAPVCAYVTDRQLAVQSTTVADPFAAWRDAERAPDAPGGLPAIVEQAARDALDGLDLETAGEQIIFPLPSLVVRIVPLERDGAVGLALFLERVRAGTDLDAVAQRYRISARELAVARLLIEGASLEEVGRQLTIAAPTVAAHVRSLVVKTGSRRRAEMVARLLGW